jgi:NAD(P)-dependent dehydrogenase (short-subunit alcohol dehydrogenase family)
MTSQASASTIDGRVCVVTGGARGLGLAIVTTLARAGAIVVIVDREQPILEASVADLVAAGHRVHGYVADITDEAEVGELAANVRAEVGLATVLVNNAGLVHIGPTLDYSLADWNESLGVMATGAFLCCRAFGAQMRTAGDGRIVNISSINARVHFPMRTAYDAAKAAVESMTQSLAIEWAGYGIRVNAIAPGVMDTRMLRDAAEAGQIDIDAYLAHVPMRRLGDPREIADAALFLVSDASSFVTGHVLTVDGGWSAFGWVPWSNDPERP